MLRKLSASILATGLVFLGSPTHVLGADTVVAPAGDQAVRIDDPNMTVAEVQQANNSVAADVQRMATMENTIRAMQAAQVGGDLVPVIAPIEPVQDQSGSPEEVTTLDTSQPNTVHLIPRDQASLDRLNQLINAYKSAFADQIAGQAQFAPRFNGLLSGIRPRIFLNIANNAAYQQAYQQAITTLGPALQQLVDGITGSGREVDITFGISDNVLWVTVGVPAAGGHYDIGVGLEVQVTPGQFRLIDGRQQQNPPTATSAFLVRVDAVGVGRDEAQDRPGYTGNLGRARYSSIEDLQNFLNNDRLRNVLTDLTAHFCFGGTPDDERGRFLLEPLFPNRNNEERPEEQSREGEGQAPDEEEPVIDEVTEEDIAATGRGAFLDEAQIQLLEQEDQVGNEETPLFVGIGPRATTTTTNFRIHRGRAEALGLWWATGMPVENLVVVETRTPTLSGFDVSYTLYAIDPTTPWYNRTWWEVSPTHRFRARSLAGLVSHHTHLHVELVNGELQITLRGQLGAAFGRILNSTDGSRGMRLNTDD